MDERYFWSATDGKPLDKFLRTTKPSIVTERDAPWIWVQGGTGAKEDPDMDTGHGAALVEAHNIMNELQVHMDWAETHGGFSKRGPGGKKAYIDKMHNEATEKLKAVSKKHKYTVGKWLLFPKHNEVDHLWSSLAPSIASGPLLAAGVELGKVATTRANHSSYGPGPGPDPDATHVICLYIDDIYHKPTVRKVLQVLLSNHGVEPSAAKSDLYTLAGIDSAHRTKLRSSIWRCYEVLDGGREEVKALKAKYVPPRPIKSKDNEGNEERRQPKKAGKDGMIDSDSEDERMTRGNHALSTSAAAEEAATAVPASAMSKQVCDARGVLEGGGGNDDSVEARSGAGSSGGDGGASKSGDAVGKEDGAGARLGHGNGPSNENGNGNSNGNGNGTEHLKTRTIDELHDKSTKESTALKKPRLAKKSKAQVHRDNDIFGGDSD